LCPTRPRYPRDLMQYTPDRVYAQLNVQAVPKVESVFAGCKENTESYLRGTATVLQARHPRPPPSIASGKTRVDPKVEYASANLPLLSTTRRLDASCLVSDAVQERMQVAVCCLQCVIALADKSGRHRGRCIALSSYYSLV